MGLKLDRLKDLNSLIAKITSSKLTYRATKTNFLKATGESLSKSDFQKGLKLRLFRDGQKVTTAEEVSQSVRKHLDVNLKSMKKVRSKLGRSIHEDIIGFRRLHGRVIPIRGHK